MLTIGSLVDNKYKVLSVIGHGGMSVVYLAINERANKTWAIKEVRKDGVVDFESVRQGLVVETDMLKKLNHPHLPSIIDVIDQDDSFLIVMDYVEGKSLQSILKNGGAQSPDQVIEWGKQLCDVLGYLHSQNPPIIYRDMKPSNVMLKPDGNITLIDFGTAREFKNRAMVEDTTCLGTRGYAAPEQFGGRGQTDARTDIYCTGATLYHLLTGHSPAEPPYEIKPLSYWDPNFAGSGLEKVINKCCQQDPNARYQNCAELLYALEHVSDEDDAVKKSRKTKWSLFVASLVIFLVGAIGMVAFRLLGNGAANQTYSAYINEAEVNLSTPVIAMDYIKNAVEIDPGRPEAYKTLFNLIIRDDVMTAQEKTQLNALLDQTSDGEKHIDALKREAPEEYGSIAYNYGMLFAFTYETNQDKTCDERAAYFFREAKNSSSLTADRQKLAECMETICNYTSAGRSGESGNAIRDTGALGDKLSASEFWQQLQTLLDGDEAITEESLRLSVYERISALIDENINEFKGSVPQEELLQALSKMESYVNGLGSTETKSLQDLRTSTLESLQITASNVEQFYNSKPVPTDKEG